MVKVEVVFEERYWYPDDGSIVWLSGYQVVDETGRYLARDAPELAARGLRVTGVAGAGRHHAEALQSDLAAPGRSLALRRDPANEHDPNAVAVHVAAGEAAAGAPDGDEAADTTDRAAGAQVGFIPREVAAEVAPQLDAGTIWTALSLRESRPSPRDARKGLTILLARADAVELHVVPRRGPPRA